MKSNIAKGLCEDKMASREADNDNNVDTKGTKKTEVSKPSNTCKQIQQTSNINIVTETMTGLPQHNRDKFIKFSSTGILNHYGPTFRNIKKDLERLNIRQEVLSVDISTETTKLRQANAHVSLEEMISVTNFYKDKFVSLKSSMIQLSERTVKLRERACKLQELKQSEALEKEAKRAQHLAREKALIAKNDS